MSNLKDYKDSDYNLRLDYDEGLYLFNMLSGGLGKLKEENINKIIDYSKLSDAYMNGAIDDTFLSSLVEGGMLIDKDVDELNLIKVLHYKSRFGGPKSYALTIAPTLACNFRCSYCYQRQNNYPNERMNDETAARVIDLVRKNAVEKGSISINWYGGEPLMEMDRISQMHSAFIEIAKDKEAFLHSGIVTNGYLLDKETSEELLRLGIKTIQITLDGDEETHNKRRPLAGGSGSYNQIINNLLLLSDELKVSIRVNIDKENIESVDKLLDNLASYGVNNKKNISVYFSIVRNNNNSCMSNLHNCYSIFDYANEEINLYHKAMEKGFYPTRVPRPNLVNCGAINPYAYVIEPDGGMQKCWNTVGDKEKRVGHLYEINDKYKANELTWLAWEPFSNNRCTKCGILPICMGGCPYYSIYEGENNEYRCNPFKHNLNGILKLMVEARKKSK